MRKIYVYCYGKRISFGKQLSREEANEVTAFWKWCEKEEKRKENDNGEKAK